MRGSYKGGRVSNTVALKADKENKQYKLFANGELIATLDQEAFKFISDITGVDNVMLGGTMRQGTVAYPFGGSIERMQVYQDVLSDDELIAVTGKTIYERISFMQEMLQNPTISESHPFWRWILVQ